MEIVEGDTVIISASPIPGNETLVSRTIDNLLRQGAKVLYSRIAMVHVHGHASREELKLMLGLVKPKFFVPIHGEFRHLMAHAAIAESTGVERQNIFVLEDGDVLALEEERGEVVDDVPAGYVYVDGNRRWGTESAVLDERRRLSRDGVVILTVTMDRASGELLKTPELTSRGFVDTLETDEIFEKASDVVQKALEKKARKDAEWGQVEIEVRREVARYLHDETGIRPLILTQIELI